MEASARVALAEVASKRWMGGWGHWAAGHGEHLWALGHRADALHPANRVLAATLRWAPR